MIIEGIPIELKEIFETDPMGALRDLACFKVGTYYPFLIESKALDSVTSQKNPFDDKTLRFDEDFGCKDKKFRYMHIDLGLGKPCACGISMAHVKDWVIKPPRVDPGPIIEVDFLGRLFGQDEEEFFIPNVRSIIYELNRRGFDFGLITYDGFQSNESRQILKREGYRVARLSIDRTATAYYIDKNTVRAESTNGQFLSAYITLRSAINEERLEIPFHPYWMIECRAAEEDNQKGEVRTNSTIDLLQSVAGSVFNLVNNEVQIETEEPNVDEDTFYRSPDEDIFYENPDEDTFYSIGDDYETFNR